LNPQLLLATLNSSLKEKLSPLLQSHGIQTDKASTGKEAQSLLFKNNYSAVVLDIDLSDFSSIEVLKYIKLSKQNTKVLLYVPGKEHLEEMGLDEKKLSRLGIMEVLYDPFRPEAVVKTIQEWFQGGSSWKNVNKVSSTEEGKETKILDRELTQVPIKDAIELNIAVFDHYIRLAPNKYVKVVNQGEPFPAANITKYAQSGCEYLYFLTSDRAAYINFMNELTEKMVRKQALTKKAVRALKNTTEKFLDEVHTKGIRPSLVEEGLKLCQNMFQLISRDEGLNETLKSLEELDPNASTHSFLVTFYSIIMCKNIDWIGPRALDTISLGALLHDIGTLKLPPAIRESVGKGLSPKDLALYQDHPRLGAQMLMSSSLINEQVRQIVYQHHEFVNGTGYPNGLTGLKIYPLAKIVSLAEGFTDKLIEMKAPPKQVVKAILMDRNEIVKYDANMIRALVNGLI
jgi:putative nucleotidyltransferase with HDIG domain